MVALAVGQEQPPPPPPAPASPFTLPDTSPPPGPVKPERLNASVEGDVVKGSPVELEAEVAFLFKTEKGYVVLRSEAGDLLVEEPALTCPPGLKAEIKTAVAELARVDVGDGIGEGFAIRCRLVVTAEASAPLGEQAITVAFPAASKAAGIIKAVSPKDAPTCTYNVQVFESFEQLEKTKAAELVAQEETRRAEQDAKLSTDGDVINGVPARLEGEVEFVFWTDKVKGSYRKVPIAFALTEDYKLVAPPGLKVTVESVSIEVRPVSKTEGNYESTYDAYFIKARLLVTAPKGTPEGTRALAISFPRVVEARQVLQAMEPEQTPVVNFTVRNFQNTRALGNARWWMSLLYGLGALVVAVVVAALVPKAFDSSDSDWGPGCGWALLVACIALLCCAGYQFYMMFSYLRMML